MNDFGPIVRNWGYYGPGQVIGDLHVSQGQYMGGFVAGIMTLHSWLPKPPGHVAMHLHIHFRCVTRWLREQTRNACTQGMTRCCRR